MLQKLCMFLLCCLPAMAAENVILHVDRDTPKLIFEPDYTFDGQNKDGVVPFYLRANWQRLGLAADAANLVAGRVQESLLGTHYHYPQMYQGLPVEGAEVIVSVKENNHIYRVFNSAWPEPTAKQARNVAIELDREEAMDMAWEHLRVHGRLTGMPEANKVWQVQDGRFSLIWRTQLIVDAPYGSWSVAVDAVTGKVLSAEDVATYRKPRAQADYAAYKGPITDRVSDIRRLASIEDARRQKQAASSKRADGSGNVFDPDPRTSLNDESLEDDDDPAAFTDAYFVRDLLDITDTGAGFELVGPWVQIITFESPSTQPSVSADGTWDFTRGNNAFNDAMTYFHLDQNQRYMQSLGFSGAKAIQNVSIETDTDGLFGADNSHYLSGTTSLGVNRLSFGHGCVDDNEDADVILHEYGHAINKFINNSWFGGDTGAMGEGFGDYWGGAYSYTTPNGKIFHPEWIYSWDGHSFDCWPGRNLDSTHLVYDSSRTYGAHSGIPGGVSDELWSTPLFQAMVALDNMGHPTSEADQAILEAQFGLGSSILMPDLAQSTVNAAAMLFPGGPHAQAFHDAFAVHSINTTIETTAPSFTYTSAHVPASNDWVNEIQIVNPSASTANITAHVFELGGSGYTETDTDSFTLGAGEATTYTPAGSAQRWVSFESDQVLSGTSFFSRLVAGRGEEKAGIPLFQSDEMGTSLIIPHIPGNREFFSAAVILNPNDSAASLTYELYDNNGNSRISALTTDAPASLAAREKWVGFLAPFPGLTSMFDDETDGGEKVSYVVVNSDQPLVAFELFGYKADEDGNSALATAGIKALPDSSNASYPVRVSLTGALYSGFSVLNTLSRSQSIDVTVLGVDGRVLAQETMEIPTRGKLLGLNIDDPDSTFNPSFTFPTSAPVVDLNNPQDIQAVVITGESLRVFELTGSGVSEIDGGAVSAPADQIVFAKPQGTLEVLKVSGTGDLSVVTSNQGVSSTVTASLSAGESFQMVLDEGLDSVNVSGGDISAAIIDKNETDGSLSVVNGTQLEGSSGKQNP